MSRVQKIAESLHLEATFKRDLTRAVKSVRELVHQGKPYPVAINQVSGETGIHTSDISDALKPVHEREKKITWKKPDLSRRLSETPEVTGLLKKMGYDTGELKTLLKTGRLTTMSRLDLLKKHVNMTLDETDVDEHLTNELSEKGRLTLEAPIIVRFVDGTYLGLSGDKSVNLALSKSLPLVAWLVELPDRRPHQTSLF